MLILASWKEVLHGLLQEYNLEVLAVETTTSSNDTYYNAAAWVLANSTMAQYYLDDDETTDPFAALEGKTACHTGWLKSAGMLMPMGYLIGNDMHLLAMVKISIL